MEKKSVREWIKIICSGILGGGLIGIGGTVFLMVGSVMGAFLFSIGLFTILVFGLNLYTGKAGYIPERDLSYLPELAAIWFGNLIGTYLVALLIKNTRLFLVIGEKCADIVNIKLSDNPISILILSMFCGLLMYVSVDTFKTNTKSIIQVTAVFMGVMVFILAGFEHVIANMYYISLAGQWSMKAVMYVLIMTIGNSLGAVIIPLYKKI